MCEGYVEKPLYLLIAEWMMAENRWVIAREISIHFDIEHSKAVNTLTYIQQPGRIRQDHRLGVTSVVPCKRGRFSSICLSGCVSCNDA